MHKRIESISGVMSINEEYTLNNKLNMQSKNQKNTFKIINIYLNLSVFIKNMFTFSNITNITTHVYEFRYPDKKKCLICFNS